MSLDQRLARRLDELEESDALRVPPAVSHREGARYQLDGRPVVGFCSNDYLGLAGRPRDAPETFTGAGASRLICGDLAEHRALERSLASLVDTEDAVLFPSGFQLNVGVLPAVLDPDDIAYSDRLNHASLIDGLRLSRATVQILPHLAAPPTAGPGQWWITESVFSMDGDLVDLLGLRAHAKAGGYLYVDEAHALGLFPGGRGLLPTDLRPDILVGTLSKALGCAGAFAAGSATVCDWIRNRARSYIFSTGPSPRVLSDIRHAIDFVSSAEGDRRRHRLTDNIRGFAAALGLSTPPPSPIIPILIGPNDAALRLARRLLERGWHVQPIRPPTVPDGTARLRITLSAIHRPEDIEALARDLRELLDADRRPLRVGAAA